MAVNAARSSGARSYAAANFSAYWKYASRQAGLRLTSRISFCKA
jgi:hypothetical protein